MDLTPETLRSATFRDKLRGYHPDDVDEFLESVARGLEVLLARLRDASERARASATASLRRSTPTKRYARLPSPNARPTWRCRKPRLEAERLLTAAEDRARSIVGRRRRATPCRWPRKPRRNCVPISSGCRRRAISSSAKSRRSGHGSTASAAASVVRSSTSPTESNRVREASDVPARQTSQRARPAAPEDARACRARRGVRLDDRTGPNPAPHARRRRRRHRAEPTPPGGQPAVRRRHSAQRRRVFEPAPIERRGSGCADRRRVTTTPYCGRRNTASRRMREPTSAMSSTTTRTSPNFAAPMNDKTPLGPRDEDVGRRRWGKSAADPVTPRKAGPPIDGD